jgi:hypothetical protein
MKLTDIEKKAINDEMERIHKELTDIFKIIDDTAKTIEKNGMWGEAKALAIAREKLNDILCES